MILKKETLKYATLLFFSELVHRRPNVLMPLFDIDYEGQFLVSILL